jgi:hypothetical protein
LFESLFYLTQLLVVIPYFVFVLQKPAYVQILLAGDLLILLALATLSAVAARRISVFYSLPYYYPLRFLEIAIFVWAFIEVVMLRRFTGTEKGWETKGRRYQLDTDALKDTAR